MSFLFLFASDPCRASFAFFVTLDICLIIPVSCVISLRCSWKSPGRLLGGGVTDAGASIDFFPVDQ